MRGLTPKEGGITLPGSCLTSWRRSGGWDTCLLLRASMIQNNSKRSRTFAEDDAFEMQGMRTEQREREREIEDGKATSWRRQYIVSQDYSWRTSTEIWHSPNVSQPAANTAVSFDDCMAGCPSSLDKLQEKLQEKLQQKLQEKLQEKFSQQQQQQQQRKKINDWRKSRASSKKKKHVSVCVKLLPKRRRRRKTRPTWMDAREDGHKNQLLLQFNKMALFSANEKFTKELLFQMIHALQQQQQRKKNQRLEEIKSELREEETRQRVREIAAKTTSKEKNKAYLDGRSRRWPQKSTSAAI
ncbi:uncharacterized protein LOC128092793 [Culex pipiens pallens]|uniref:uncharacterized protein LOC128092793 n=1 Tax=Culex pipiens pallens TaxID=42434 RepID=UPI0022AB447B|nr:uncharacterized protein LOC128092793 [Culex pipiens pallens]